MAGPLDQFDRIPIWQRLLLFVLVAGVIWGGWFFLFYQDAVAAQNGASAALKKAEVELTRVKKEKENFLEREREIAELEEKLKKQREVLPTTTASVDNLMQTFQQQARLVGLTVESWTPVAEQKQDFYARLPIKVRASGTWTQVGEFFRRVSELDRPVSVENVDMKAKGRRAEADGGGPQLEISFETVTYRMLQPEERAAGNQTKRKNTKSRRK